MNDAKDRYRKKSYTSPEKKIKPTAATRAILARIREASKPDHGRKELFDILIDLGNKGADLAVVVACLHYHDRSAIFPKGGKGLKEVEEARKKMGIREVDILFARDSQHKNVLAEHTEAVIKWTKRKRTLRQAINILCKVEPLPLGGSLPDKLIKSLYRELEDAKMALSVFERYIDLKEEMQFPTPLMMRSEEGKLIRNPDAIYYVSMGRPAGVKKTNAVLQLNEKIRILSDEMRRIGYANKSADENTAKLLNLSYPNIRKKKKADDGMNADIVRQSRIYYRKKK